MIAKYNCDDMVKFTYTDINDNEILTTGKIFIVDAYGTFFNPDEVCYDIFIESKNLIIKHVPEKCIFRKI